MFKNKTDKTPHVTVVIGLYTITVMIGLYTNIHFNTTSAAVVDLEFSTKGGGRNI